MRALVLAHGSPRAGIGGGELAAHTLFRALRARGDVAADFLARSTDPRIEPGAIGRVGPGEFLWRQETADWFAHRGDERGAAAFADFLAERRPNAVFVQHFAHIGAEVLPAIRHVLPEARIVLTLHDFAAICHNGGLMAKTGYARIPCGRAEPQACHACFPAHAPDAFAARRAAMLRHFAPVDRFVSPSRFLAGRYGEWGLDPARIAVIANGLEPSAPAPTPEGDGRIRLGFFGQVREAKGLDILLAALHRLEPDERRCFELSVNGSRLEAQGAWYRELIERLRAPLLAEGTLRWPGAYGRDELASRMAGLAFAVVPSTFVENAPIVIQEAFAHGVPVIGAGHGGIAEMVRDGIDGLLFPPHDPRALEALLGSLLADPGRQARLAANIRPPFTAVAMAAAYRDLAASIRA
ncbi:glycosyltransferase [Aureimonas leprariae]|nr:glycosyltransferase [Aureimonas leprariae]